MPPDVWVIMGHAAVGKSSTIRALTGVWRLGKTNVQTVQGTLNDIFIQVRSLQEKGIKPSDFIIVHNSDRYILLSLRINSRTQYPNGLRYIQAFINNNWRIREIIVLGTNVLPYNLPRSIPTPMFIPNSKNTPANQIAHQIRGIWNWL